MGVSIQNAGSLMAVQRSYPVRLSQDHRRGMDGARGGGAAFLLGCSHLGNQSSVCLSLIRTPPCEVLKGMSGNRALPDLLSGEQENPLWKPLFLKVPSSLCVGVGSPDLAQAHLSWF